MTPVEQRQTVLVGQLRGSIKKQMEPVGEDFELGCAKCDPGERELLARAPPGYDPGEQFSAGHERKDSPTEVFSDNQVIGWGAVQLGAQLGPQLVSRIRVEPSAEVQPLQAVVGVPVIGAGEQHLHQVEPVAYQRGDQFQGASTTSHDRSHGTLGRDRRSPERESNTARQ